MKKLVDIKKMKKLVGATLACAAIAFSATSTCLAAEPACAAELSNQIGTALHYEETGNTAVLTIMGQKDEVLVDFVKAKYNAIAAGELVFAQLQHNIDTNEAEAKLVMKKGQVFYNGCVISYAIEGNTDDAENEIQEFLDREYKLVDLESWGNYYDRGGQTRCTFAKRIN